MWALMWGQPPPADQPRKRRHSVDFAHVGRTLLSDSPPAPLKPLSPQVCHSEPRLCHSERSEEPAVRRRYHCPDQHHQAPPPAAPAATTPTRAPKPAASPPSRPSSPPPK